MKRWHVLEGLLGTGFLLILACFALLANGFFGWHGARHIPLALGLAFNCFVAAITERVAPHIPWGRLTTVQVIDERVSADGDGTTYALVIRYRVNDAKHVFTAAVSSSSRYAIGDPVRVSYLPRRPEDAWLKTWMQFYFFPGVFFALGGAAVELWVCI